MPMALVWWARRQHQHINHLQRTKQLLSRFCAWRGARELGQNHILHLWYSDAICDSSTFPRGPAQSRLKSRNTGNLAKPTPYVGVGAELIANICGISLHKLRRNRKTYDETETTLCRISKKQFAAQQFVCRTRPCRQLCEDVEEDWSMRCQPPNQFGDWHGKLHRRD